MQTFARSILRTSPIVAMRPDAELVALIENAKSLGVSVTTTMYGDTITEVTINGVPRLPHDALCELRTLVGNITEERR